jgi:transcriptional regulator with XRE-family HTH domain
MARHSLNPMKDVDFRNIDLPSGQEKSGKKRKDAPMTHLKYLRKSSGYTLEMLSDITSISISYLSRLESGSRRLNTDLIRRLSHAFGCEPSELLEEISHENDHVITPIEFGRKRRFEVASKEQGIPLYCICADKDSNDLSLTIRAYSPMKWRQRPSELDSKKDVFAVKSEGYLKPYFDESSTLYLEAATSLSPESTVIIVESGKVMVKKVWSVTPTSLQLCNIGDIESLKNDSSSQNKLVNVNRSSLDSIYKVIGFSSFGVE